ncbi:MAG: DNA repair protein RadC, partial [Pseudomonadota bacterium]
MRQTPSPHAGHRARLRERMMRGGPDALPDYELLELVLFGAIARGDTKPLAKRLIARFGTFADVISAPAARLQEVTGVGPAVVAELKLVQAASIRLLGQNVIEQPILSSWQSVVDYCRAALGYADVEEFHILFLDKRNKLVLSERQQRGTVDHTPVYVREVCKRALEVSATALVLVHNHPSGETSPSRADIDMTNRIVEAMKPLGIAI